jgi:HD superfamily phosphohydrolase
VPPQPAIPEGDFPILVDGETKILRKFSPLVTILERAHRSSWRFGVYTTEEERERVKLASRRCLNLKREAVQHTLPDI